MKRHTIVGLVLALALYGCGRGRASQQTLPSTAAETADEATTIVGCLVPSGETTENRAVGTAGNPEPPRFALVNVTTPVKGSARSFELVADQNRLDDLQRFSNSRVEVSGFVVTSSDVRRIRVKDVRQLEHTCGEPQKK
jgi:hypothetical protein